MNKDQKEAPVVNLEMKNTPAHQLFIAGLNEMYATEEHLIKITPHFIDEATSTGVKGEIMKHLDRTRQHVLSLDTIFSLLEELPDGRNCKALRGLEEEAEDLIAITGRGTMLRDAAVIMALKRIEYYELTSYISLVTLSDLMGHRSITDFLEHILKDEEDAYEGLRNLEEQTINIQALKE